VQAHPRTAGPRIGVLMVSGSVGEHNETDRLSAGADGFVPKPVIQSELLNAIRQCLNLRWEGLATEPPAERADAAPPSAQVVRELLALAAGGYPKALRARLAELSQESAASAAWVAHLAPLVETDAPGLKALLVETLRDTRHE
jgi:hypothetical protein